MTVAEKIAQSRTHLGIELGSTRIKAVLIDDSFTPIASGSHEWENRLENGYWTYPLEDIHSGIQSCYADLKKDVMGKYGTELTSIGSMGISAMMHGYMAFDKDNNLLVPFRTWRNTTTEQAADKLTRLFGFNIPQRWSIAHLYQAVLNGEEHLERLAHLTTLAGYIHYMLTGVRALGIGEASGMFPISEDGYCKEMLAKFSALDEVKKYSWDIEEILPEIKKAGDPCGTLTESGALFLDPTGALKAGIPFCAPEGDAGTGMTATCAVRTGTGNISAGTSIFAMLVMDKLPEKYYPEIDMVTTPDGSPVAMVHCNNCCSELDAWVKIFGEFAELTGAGLTKSELYEKLYTHALTGDKNCGKITAYNFLSGEPVAGIEQGSPMYFRSPSSTMTLANFMRAQLCSAMASLKMGMDILFENEKASCSRFMGHGGLFKVKGAAQQLMADALDTPVATMQTAGEGGAWGMALLAAYMHNTDNMTLPDWLDSKVFAHMEKSVISPDSDGVKGFAEFIGNYKAGLAAEKIAGKLF